MSNLDALATQIRRLSLQMTTKAGSGHATSALSCAEILAVLFSEVLKVDPSVPQNIGNDRFILSKGHAAPALYAIYALCGWIPMKELDTLRQKDSRLEGHPTRQLPYVDVATGSLGQGLANGLGMAWGLQGSDPVPMVYVLMGDGELAEGSVWEALATATSLGLTHICAIVDVNGMGQSGPSLFAGNMAMLSKRFESFGWKTHVVDGHDTQALSVVLGMVPDTQGPHAVLCSTIKGKGVSLIEGKEGWHGKPLIETQLLQALEELGDPHVESVKVKKPLRTLVIERAKIPTSSLSPTFLGLTATKKAFGLALADLCSEFSDVIALDADMKNSTEIDQVLAKTPRQLLECSIAESTMVSMAEGLDVVGKRAVVSTFAAFLTRAHDQLRMSSLSSRSFVVNGAYGGVSIGKDGASQMGLEDIAMMRSLPGCTVLYPSDAYSSYLLTRDALNQPGMTYIRTTREPTPLLYAQTTKFPIGGSHVHGPSDQDKVAIIAAGITLFEALKAQGELRVKGVMVRVIDLYSIRPLDTATVMDAVHATRGALVIVEDHHPEGGIGDAVRAALDGVPVHIQHLSVKGIPQSATPQEELTIHGIDSGAIVKAVENLMQQLG